MNEGFVLECHSKFRNVFKNIVKKDKIAHAYIINSKDYISRKYLTRYFIKILQCTDFKNDICNICRACKTINNNNNPDIIYIDNPDKKNVSIEIIREKLVNDVVVKPYNNKYKIYIIENADKMTLAAQNAILKTIENPFDYIKIILLTDNNKKLLDTINSRCILINIDPVDIINMKKVNKENSNITDISIYFSQGDLSKLNQFYNSEEFISLRNFSLEIIEKMLNMNALEFIQIEKELLNRKDNFDNIIDFIILYLRDINIIKINNTEVDIVNKDKYEQLNNIIGNISYNYLNKVINEVYKAKNKIKDGANIKLVISSMLVNIKFT